MSFDQMEYEDFSWIRWDRMRWDFVDLLISAAAQHTDRERSFLCTGLLCCLDIQKISDHLGFEIHRNRDDEFYGFIDFREDLQSEVTSAMRDGMSMVSTYIRYGSGHPFEGHMEVPWEVARIANSSYFTKANRDDKLAPHVSDEPSEEIGDLLYAFVKLAFPDQFLATVRMKNVEPQNLERKIFGWDANAELTQRFESHDFVAPLLSTGIIENLTINTETSETGTDHFWMDNETAWQFGAGYNLDFGLRDASLNKYWHWLESIPHAFEYSEHANQAGCGMGFLARSYGLFVSQQVWDSNGNWKWNACTESFNKNLAPVLEKSGADGAAMVVFSDYRGDAYIVSSVKASWDEYAPMRAIHGPLPDGFGIVGVWTNYDEARYTPRSFDEIINANWSEQITASARYLRDCLAAMNRD